MKARRKTAAIALFAISVILLNFPMIQFTDAGGEDTGRFPGVLIYLPLVWLGISLGLYYLNHGNSNSPR